MKNIKYITLFLVLFTTLKITAQIGIGVEMPKAQLHVVKEGTQPTMIVEDLEERTIEAKHKNLYVDEKGEIVVAKTSGLTTLVTSYNASKELNLKETTDNQLIPFSDVTTPQVNNASTFIPAEEAFEILEDGIYDVSGYVGFNPQLNDKRADPTANLAVVLAVQVKRKAGGNYSTFASPRYILTGLALGVRSTIVLPSTLIELKAGDRVRMVINTPVTFGSFTVRGEDPQLPNIVKVGASLITRSFLIKKM